MPYCNCGSGCCCCCARIDCYNCDKRKIYTYVGSNKNYYHCEIQCGTTHFVCPYCRRGWKDGISRKEMTVKKAVKYSKAKRCCSQCGREGFELSSSFRLPKKKDNAGWKMVKKILLESQNDVKARGINRELFTIIISRIYEFKQDHYFTSDRYRRILDSTNGVIHLSDLWLCERKFVYDTEHLANAFSYVLSPPHNIKYYDNFINRICNTAMLTNRSSENFWNLLRRWYFVWKIVRYLRKTSTIRVTKERYKKCLNEILLLPPSKHNNGGRLYCEAYQRFNSISCD